jgi:hypothetical protein
MPRFRIACQFDSSLPRVPLDGDEQQPGDEEQGARGDDEPADPRVAAVGLKAPEEKPGRRTYAGSLKA